MVCAQCGQRLDPGATFCTNCGAKVERGESAPALARGGRSRPLGVVVVVIMTALSGLVTLAALAALMSIVGMAQAIQGAAMGFGRPERVPFWIPLLMVAVYFYAVLDLAAAYGLAAFERWALPLARAVWGLSIPAAVIFMLVAERDAVTILSGLATIGVAIGVLVYLSNPDFESI